MCKIEEKEDRKVYLASDRRNKVVVSSKKELVEKI